MRFFVGLQTVADAGKLPATQGVFLSVNRLWSRKSWFPANDWIMDSGGYSEVAKHGGYRHDRGVADYAERIRFFAGCGNLLAAVAQDYTVQPEVLSTCGKTVLEHQQLTIERYTLLVRSEVRGIYIMPVLQGQSAADYVAHLEQYGDRIGPGAWVCVGSLVGRYTAEVEDILLAIKRRRPDLRLHGLGLKRNGLASARVRRLLFSADSLSWSLEERRRGRNPHAVDAAARFAQRLDTMPIQLQLSLFGEEP